jgi:N-acetylmuramic acid 6-phosphate etherase
VTDDRQHLDQLAPDQLVDLLLGAEERVVPAVRAAAAEIVAAAQLLARSVTAGGRLVFAGAGTSGRIAVAQAAELPGTFGLDPARVVGLLAGGRSAVAAGEYDEDDVDAGRADVDDLGLTAGDVLIAVAVSGRTPYTVACADRAAAADADVIAVVSEPNSPLAAIAGVAIVVPVGDEVLRGSTRLSAGTAHKVALDATTTVAMTLAGRVHGDLMIDVVAANAKLHGRAVAIVAEIAGCDDVRARVALEDCGWNARAAVVRLVLGIDPDAAAERAAAHRSLRDALSD